MPKRCILKSDLTLILNLNLNQLKKNIAVNVKEHCFCAIHNSFALNEKNNDSVLSRLISSPID